MRSAPLTAIATAATLAIAGASTASAAAPQATTLEKVSALVQPSIVYLETTYTGYVRDAQGRWLNARLPLETTASCSGFFINPDGHLATAGHCVDRSEGRSMLIEKAIAKKQGFAPTGEQLDHALATYVVHSAKTPAQSGPDREVEAAYGVDYGGLRAGKPLPARVSGIRPFLKGDVALLKIEAENVPTVQLAPVDSVQVGSEVVSVGYPASVDLATDPTFDPSFKEGSISSKRTIERGLVKVNEISAALSGGMSGGPTVDLQGRVVGVNSFGIVGEPQPFNFVSPVSEVAGLLSDEGVTNTLGRTNQTYRRGLTAYWAGDRAKAIARFDDVLGQVYEHEFARQFRAKAMRLPVAKPTRSGGGFPATLVGLAGLALSLLAAAIAVVARRRRGGSDATSPSSPHTPRPTGTPVQPHRAVDGLRSLTVVAGPMAGERITVGSDMLVGRGHADFELDDSEVSRRHAKVTPTAAGLVITDLGSANGTKVNGARIDRPMLLVHGDEITLGDTVLRVNADERGQATVLRPRRESAAA